MTVAFLFVAFSCLIAWEFMQGLYASQSSTLPAFLRVRDIAVPLGSFLYIYSLLSILVVWIDARAHRLPWPSAASLTCSSAFFGS